MPLSLPTVCVHGLDYLDLSPEQLRVHLAVYLRTQRNLAVFTPNATIGAACRKDADLASLVRQAELLLPDGAGVVLASRLACPTHPLRYQLPGIETGEVVLRLCEELGLSVYFLGGRPGVAKEAAMTWKGRLPHLRVAGTHDGYFEKTGDENAAVVRDVAASGADVVLVCLGFPMQERWIADNRPSLPSVRLFMGLGGSFDVWSGRIRRAPSPIRRAHLEWLWRMLAEPRRFGTLFSMLRYVFSAPIRGK